ncbi:TetR/AcrR family transcriptional regulator [Pseudonocardia alaniniphila]|uniref:TetR/AcrR family transcriptional regulator n=1 Tax=Pseudonocardia alaniniphila TaxID=75291 RepID=A0ABS9TTX8_9PSEU|nr:TetR/AcrR family transcriptional regulator [Pseudonocardia alaniniphila]MCH6172000.1 TetR/AcrR family transcriptional regulator [Pseudonocardia alaniniphila]
MVTPEADNRRLQIARAAAQLFQEKGYHQTSVDDIADAVTLRKPTLYHYVKGKGEILYLIHEEMMDSVLDRLEGYVKDGLDPREGLRNVVIDILEVVDKRPGYLQVFFENHRELPEPLRHKVVDRRNRYLHLVESLVQDGIERGLFRPVNVRLKTMALFGMTNWSYQWYRPGGLFSYREIAEEIVDTFLNGVTVR